MNIKIAARIKGVAHYQFTLDLFKKYKKLTIDEIVNKLKEDLDIDVTYNQVQKHLSCLTGKGIIDNIGLKVYKLARRSK